MAIKGATDLQIAQIVEDHRFMAVKSEADLKESFYGWECAFFMKYQTDELGGNDDQDKMQSNQYIGYLHAQIETATARLLSTMYVKDPPFEVEPTGGQTLTDAQAIGALHAHSFRVSRMRRKIRQMLRYLLIYGTCPMKTFWDERYAFKGELIPIKTGEDENGITTWDYEEQTTSILQYAGPDSQVVDPYQFHVAPRSEDIETARWVQEEFIRDKEHVEDLIERGIYDKIDWEKVDVHVGDPVGHFDYQDRRRETMGTPTGKVAGDDGEGDKLTPALYDLTEEWHDDFVYTIIGRSNPQVLRARPNPMAHRQKPYTLFRYIDFANEFWGIPMARQLEGPQSELNLIRRLRSDAVLAQLKNMWRVSPGAAQSLDESDFEFRPNGIIEAEKDDIEPLKRDPLPLFSYKEEEILRTDGDLITGITDIVRGQAKASSTATVGQLNANFAQDRLGLVFDSIADSLEYMMNQRHALYQQFSEGDQIVKSIGSEGLKPVIVSPIQIAGDYSFVFNTGRNIGSRELIRNQLMQAITITSQNPELAQITNFIELLRDFWATFDMPNPGRYIIDPTEVGLTQEMEIMVMSMGEPVAVRPTDNHVKHFEIIQEFMQSEEFGQLDESAQYNINDHMQKHLPYAQQAQAASGAGQSGSPERARVDATSETTGDVLAQNQRQIAPRVRS